MSIKPGDIVRFPVIVSLDEKPVYEFDGFGRVLEIEDDKAHIQLTDKTIWEDVADLSILLTREEFSEKSKQWTKK